MLIAVLVPVRQWPLMDKGIAAKMKRLGVSHYGSSGKPADLYAEQGLDAQSIAASARKLIG